MLGKGSIRRTKYRLLILICISCCSPTPAFAATERSFSQGQPEMQQAMDNMVSHALLMKKDIKNTSDEEGKNEIINSLNEVEKILNTVNNLNEKKWIGEVVQRMKNLAETYEEIKVGSQSKHSSVNGKPVQMGYLQEPNELDRSAVPKVNPFQYNEMVLKDSVSSPELSNVLSKNRNPSIRETVTKPTDSSIIKSETSRDPLVEELESLQQESAYKVFPMGSSTSDRSQFTVPSTSTSPPENLEMKDKKLDVEFERFGKTLPKEIFEAAESRNIKFGEFQNSNPEGNPKQGIKEATTLNAQDKISANINQELNGLNGNEMRSLPLRNQNERPYYEQGNKPGSRTYDNMFQTPNEYKKMLPASLHAAHPIHTILEKKYHLPQSHPNTFQNAKLHYYNRFHYPYQNPVSGPVQKDAQNMYQNILPTHKKFHYNPPINMSANRYLKYMHGLHPYIKQWDSENSTFHQTSKINPQLPKAPVNQADIEFSEEMKRQLRDGKIIMLSDSVVHSNFEPNQEAKRNGPKSYSLSNMKNTFNTTENS